MYYFLYDDYLFNVPCSAQSCKTVATSEDEFHWGRVWEGRWYCYTHDKVLNDLLLAATYEECIRNGDSVPD